MTVLLQEKAKAKPFIKWAGGKKQLLEDIESRLPDEIQKGKIEHYIEPFIGGGAVFFYIASHYPDIKKFYISDINQDLISTYCTIKENVENLIYELACLEEEFLRKPVKSRKTFYYKMRDKFNKERLASQLIFLNKTCFNGLYRVNRKNEFNVPFGDYKTPKICDEDNLRQVSRILQKTTIVCGDFEKISRFVNSKSFIYLDPPYLPISKTSNFTSYSKNGFDFEDQKRLAGFCQYLHKNRCKFLLSNSDPQNEDPENNFFEQEYKDFNIERVLASRAINCKGNKRGRIKELIITNY
jgi:DNA adenine methylase